MMSGWEQDAAQDRPVRDSVTIADVVLRRGDGVRLHPRRRADIFDLALDGKIARIESIVEDYDGAVYVAVAMDDDPGQDLGLLGQVGHRFFFAPEEVAPLPPRILIAGIGNIFLGDDGFGSEAARRLGERPWPAEIRVVDFGVRVIDLAYALADGYQTVILLDATPQGGPPGSVYVIEPDLEAPPVEVHPSSWDPHRMETLGVLKSVKAACSAFPRLFVVGCEPADVGGESGRLGLSPTVQAAMEQAIAEVEVLIAEILRLRTNDNRP